MTGDPGPRPGAVEPFLRGVAWPAGGGVAYPRADPADARRLPADTWAAASLPAGVRLEMAGDAEAVEVSYHCATDQLGYRGEGAGVSFAVWRQAEQVDEQPAALGAGRVRLSLGSGPGPAVVYLPEGMRPVITGLEALGGRIEPVPAGPRWVAYGDSITEGWSASSPARSWVAVAARRHGLDALNLGYAGAARGEIPTAEQIARLDAEVISLAFGTNCWSMIPHSAEMMRATTVAFLRVVRGGHPGVPIVVVSPVLRPDAEERENLLGAGVADLRAAMEEAVAEIADADTVLVGGRDLLEAGLLEDGVHPGDAGHVALADAVGTVVARAAGRRR